jgi:hypothetical protein
MADRARIADTVSYLSADLPPGTTMAQYRAARRRARRRRGVGSHGYVGGRVAGERRSWSDASPRRASVHGTVPRTRVQCSIELDGRPVRCQTLLADAGPYTLALSTTLAEHGISLHSTYLGHPDADETQAAQLLLAPGRADSAAHAVDAASLPVAHRRRLCLYDHLAVLRELVSDATGNEVSVHVAEQALELVDVA